MASSTENYKELRARILLRGKKMAILGKEKEATRNLLTYLNGIATLAKGTTSG